MSPDDFAALKADFFAALGQKENLFVQDLYGGSQPEHRVRVRVVTELAWHNLFIRTMLVRPEEHELRKFIADYTIIDLPSFRADPARHGCRPTVIAVNMTEKLILIGGTRYAGEMKKSVFGLLNYLLPTTGCRCTVRPTWRGWIDGGVLRPVGHRQDHAVADASRTLIGDDEHGWSDTAIFNFEAAAMPR
jgi:phosphoenolpyruvate carboxykinase (ATP)